MYRNAVMAAILSGCGTTMATTPDSWTMWVEGDPPDWSALEAWITGGGDAKLPTGNLVIRLIDPLAASGAGAGFVLPADPSDPLPPSLAFVKEIRASFQGSISMLPYYPAAGWQWPGGSSTIPQWARPVHWVMEANQALAAHGVTNGIAAVNYENFGSNDYIVIDDVVLRDWQTYLMGLWPTWDQDPAFVGIIISKDNKSATNMLRWTTTTKGPYPDYADGYFDHIPLVGGMLECYEIYKENCTDYAGGTQTVVDVSNTPHDPPFYPPFSGMQIYEAAGHAADPASTVLGTPTLVCPDPTASPPQPSTLGFLLAGNAPQCTGGLEPPLCMTGADLSRITFLFSCDRALSAKVFGTWDGETTPATVDTFKDFVGQFDDAFRTYWSADSSKMPGYGLWDFELLPASWKGSAPSCPGDLSGDSAVDVGDVLGLIDVFGQSGGDVNADGTSDIEDLLHVLHHYGRVCH
ncbi:MAG: hypothetical protein MK116_07925 [Phycisphaerales bacterium]|nr:hypothetical protein [Phycisphaerales bacterium]